MSLVRVAPDIPLREESVDEHTTVVRAEMLQKTLTFSLLDVLDHVAYNHDVVVADVMG
jgi:tetrahydromethanopterin S-methyltransferase subunit B